MKKAQPGTIGMRKPKIPRIINIVPEIILKIPLIIMDFVLVFKYEKNKTFISDCFHSTDFSFL